MNQTARDTARFRELAFTLQCLRLNRGFARQAGNREDETFFALAIGKVTAELDTLGAWDNAELYEEPQE
jgi:hypothetical protein